MKKSENISRLLLVVLGSAGLLTVAEAQNQARRIEQMNRVRSEARPSLRAESSSRTVFQNNGTSAPSRINPPANNTNRNVFEPRNQPAFNGNNTRQRELSISERQAPTFNQNRVNNNRNPNPYTYNDRPNYNRNSGSNYSQRYYNTPRNYDVRRNNQFVKRYPVRYVYPGAPSYRVLPRSSVYINFGGNPYYYHDGLFFNNYGGFYQPTYAPFGIRVRSLPFGYYAFNVGPQSYYYANGTYFRPYDNNEYQVVDAPMGATISDLPKGAKAVNLNGEKMYEFNSTYYKEDRDARGRKVYVVVGKNGEVNNTQAPTSDLPEYDYLPGDLTDRLPDGSTSETVNGQQLFVSPAGIYFKIQVQNGETRYLVVDKPEEARLMPQEEL